MRRPVTSYGIEDTCSTERRFITFDLFHVLVGPSTDAHDYDKYYRRRG